MIESEYKFLLDKSDFFEIKSEVSKTFYNSKSFLQINYYYDDENNSLHKQDITLRVRQIGEILTLQRKYHMSRTGSLVISNESEKSLTSLPKIIDGRYLLKGSLMTQRHRVEMNGADGHFDFDENFYLGICDYEVEIETLSVTGHHAEHYISLLKMHNSSSVKGKSSRFFEKLSYIDEGAS